MALRRPPRSAKLLGQIKNTLFAAYPMDFEVLYKDSLLLSLPATAVGIASVEQSDRYHASTIALLPGRAP